jgi:hypothetical protein
MNFKEPLVPLLDPKGRLFGKVNILDLALVLLAIAVGAALFMKLTPAYRPAPAMPAPGAGLNARIVIRLEPDCAWLAEHIAPGDKAVDPRSAEVVFEVQTVNAAEGWLDVEALVRTGADSEDRLFFGNRLLLPGQRFEVATQSCVIEGRVAEVERISP